jgi:RimJ/RimL family protein N-acetyltransferase
MSYNIVGDNMKNIDNKKLCSFNTDNFSFVIYDEKNTDHIKVVQSLKNDPKVTTYFEDFEKYLIETNKTINNKDTIVFASLIKKDNDYIGSLALLDSQEDALVFSYCLEKNFRGKGLSTKIKKEVFDYIFNLSPNIKHIISYIKIENEDSLRVAMKLSFDNIERMSPEYLKITIDNKKYIDTNNKNR